MDQWDSDSPGPIGQATRNSGRAWTAGRTAVVFFSLTPAPQAPPHRLQMKTGLITDIHEDVGRLGKALERLNEEGVEQVIVLGDVCDLFHGHDQLAETCCLLSSANAIG